MTKSDTAEALARLTAPEGPFPVVEREVRGVPMRIYDSAPASLGTVLLAAERFGDRDYLVYGAERLTYRELLRQVAGFARWLRDHGVAKGDRVAIGMRNYPEWAVTFWATQALGAVAVPLNAWWIGNELAFGLADSGAKVAVLDGERVERLSDRLATLDLSAVVAVRATGPLPPLAVAWRDVCAGFDVDVTLPTVELGPDDDATMLYTSGTTGRPKGAVATHRNHVSNLTNMVLRGAIASTVATGGWDPDASPPCSLQAFPFFHIGGLTALYVHLALGGTLVLQYKWDLREALELIERERVTGLTAVPTIVRELISSPLLEGYDLTSLTGITSGGAPVPPDLILAIEQRFASAVSPGNAYGLTETTSGVVVNDGQDYLAHPDSVGRPMPIVEVRVVDPDSGLDRALGEVGEIWFRGPNVVRGYWGLPEATAEAFNDGWFRSGDLGTLDEEGFIRLVDRLKDVVIRGGENVYSVEVEARLLEHPAVADVAVIGLPHPSLGEEVAAVVQVSTGRAVSAAELQEHAAAGLARFKVPARVFLRSDPLPRNAVGKLLKRELRDELAGA